MGWGLEIGHEKLWWASATWPGELEGKHMTTAGEKEEVSIQSWLWTRLFSNAVQLWSVTELQRSRERNRNEMLGQCRYTASSSSTARDKIGTATEQRNSPFGTSAHNKTQKAPRSKAASRALCNRNFEMETGCLMNCKMLSLMREAIRSAVLLSASSFFPSQACHRHGNLDRTNREHTIPGTQQQPAALWQSLQLSVHWGLQKASARGNHCKPVTSCLRWLGAHPACHCSAWCVHCHICRSTRCHLGVIWNSATPLDLLAIFPRQLWALG